MPFPSDRRTGIPPPTLLEDLPFDAWQIITRRHLSLQALLRLRCTCRNAANEPQLRSFVERIWTAGGTMEQRLVGLSRQGWLPGLAFLLNGTSQFSPGLLGVCVRAAVETRRLDALLLLIRSGAPVNHPDGQTGHPMTALMIACDLGWAACAKALIEAGTALDTFGAQPYCGTALMFASANGHEQCTRALIEARANVDATRENGSTALMSASQNGHELCARALIEAKANVDATRNDGSTALMNASENGRELCARALIEARANVDAATRNVGWTALMLASRHGHELCARALIEARANVDATRNDGRTALMLAFTNGHNLCFKALRSAGATDHWVA